MTVFVPGYEHDIFISYAHVDDEPIPGAEEGWVSTLVGGLKTLLAQRLGRSDTFSLWMDYRLSLHEPITPELLSTIEHSAVLVVILSPGYLASEWCQRERNTFLQMVRDRPRRNSRIFVVERDKIETSERPAEFRDLLGYRFWVEDKGCRTPRILGEPRPNPSDPKSQPYYDRLNDLSHDMAEELKRIRESVESPDAERERVDTRPAVFLAEVTDDLVIQRDEVMRYLVQAGLRVLPETQLYFSEPAAFQKAVDRDLEECKIFVQLLSGLTGRRCAHGPSHICLQYQLALKAGKQILQWRSPSLDTATTADKDHRNLLEGETVLAVGLEEFKREVVELALAKPAPRVSAVCTLVFLDANREDDSLAREVVRVMEKNEIGYVLPLRSGHPADVRKDLEECLLDSDGVIVVYGTVTPVWAREQLRYCRKIMYKREEPLKAIAVYEGPPPGPKDPLNIALPGMQIIQCPICSLERALQPFFESLKREERR
ncbi:MAG: toll/interleukin-1 receptor domain-containing protein [bacterium]